MLAKLAFVSPLYDIDDRLDPEPYGDSILQSVAMDYGTLYGMTGREARA